MKKIIEIIISVLLLIPVMATAKTYYVSPNGTDSNSGSAEAPFQSLAYVSNIVKNGDSILFFGGTAISGSLKLSELDNLYIGSVNGNAIINSGNETGAIITSNCNNLTIENMEVFGLNAGPYSEGISIWFSDEIPAHDVKINNCLAQSFGNGIAVSNYQNATLKNVKITNCTAMQCNGASGIIIWDGYFNQTVPTIDTVEISGCTATRNFGGGFNTNWSGSGIMCAFCSHILINNCEAGFNGEFNSSPSGGPVGIWLAVSSYFKVTNCTSHDNKSGTKDDGGGFDADGGCSFGSFEYCKSNNNHGPGFLICTDTSWTPTYNITFRHCSSKEDGAGILGSVVFYGANATPLKDILIDSCEVTQSLSTCIVVAAVVQNIRVSNTSFCYHSPGVFGNTKTLTLFNNTFPCTIPANDTTKPQVIDTTGLPAIDTTGQPANNSPSGPGIDTTKLPVIDSTKHPVTDTTKAIQPTYPANVQYLKAYPNPANNSITFSVYAGDGNYQFEIVSANGQIMASWREILNKEIKYAISLVNYRPGTYIAVLRNENGVKAKQTFIKQ